tara:strand:+ start:19161 stop:20264 length:1104 start_codon:yes stop_codon:yes gene_type:complete
MNNEILLFIPAIENGGVEKNFLWLTKKLKNRNYNFKILYYYSNNSNFMKYFADNSLKTKFFNSNFFKKNRIMQSLICSLNLFLYLLKNKTSLVISFQSNLFAIPPCKILNVPLIIRISNHFSVSKYEKSPIRKMSEFFKFKLYKYAGKIVCISKQIEDDFKQKSGSNTTCIYNPVTQYPNYEKKVNKKLSILTIGRLCTQKNFETAICAMELLKKKKIDFELNIIGEGYKKSELNEMVKNKNLSEEVKFLGYQSNSNKFLATADLYLQTSLYEGFCNSIAEAVSMQVPVISTDCKSGPKEILVYGEGGTLVPIRDYKEIAKQIENFINDKKIFINKSKNAYSNLKLFDDTLIENKYLELIDSFIYEK